MLAPDHRCVLPAVEALSSNALDGQQPVGRDELRFALEGERLHGLHPGGVTHQAMGQLTDKDVARGGRLLEARCGVDGVAGYEPLTEVGVARDHLAGIHADLHLHSAARRACKASIQAGKGSLHLKGRAGGPKRVVLVKDRQPEDRHHRVADELLDGGAVLLQDPPHEVEVVGHRGAGGLG